jgi:hypothetical protein
MSDPVPSPTRRQPPRAQPLQPDRPGSGDAARPADDPAGRAPAGGNPGPGGGDTARRSREQSDDALDNVREGYGGAP